MYWTGFILLLGAAALQVQQAAGKAQCFSKVERCCWKYKGCGKETLREPFLKGCPYKKCVKKCAPVCAMVKVALKPKTVCTMTKYYFEHCKKIAQFKKVKKCKKVCKDVCTVVAAKCLCEKVVVYDKFCAFADCKKPTLTGSFKKPAGYRAKKGKVMKVEFVRRIAKKAEAA